jgi:hypothetical protein
MWSQEGKKVKSSRCDREEGKIVGMIVDISIPVRDRRNDNLIIERSRFWRRYGLLTFNNTSGVGPSAVYS